MHFAQLDPINTISWYPTFWLVATLIIVTFCGGVLWLLGRRRRGARERSTAPTSTIWTVQEWYVVYVVWNKKRYYGYLFCVTSVGMDYPSLFSSRLSSLSPSFSSSSLPLPSFPPTHTKETAPPPPPPNYTPPMPLPTYSQSEKYERDGVLEYNPEANGSDDDEESEEMEHQTISDSYRGSCCEFMMFFLGVFADGSNHHLFCCVVTW